MVSKFRDACLGWQHSSPGVMARRNTCSIASIAASTIRPSRAITPCAIRAVACSTAIAAGACCVVPGPRPRYCVHCLRPHRSGCTCEISIFLKRRGAQCNGIPWILLQAAQESELEARVAPSYVPEQADTAFSRKARQSPVLCSQGLAAPSLAVLGPKGVARLPPVCDAPFLSQGLAGAGRPAD